MDRRSGKRRDCLLDDAAPDRNTAPESPPARAPGMTWSWLGVLSLLCGCSPLDLGTDIIWSADHETGDLTQWSASPGSGGRLLEYGGPSVEASTEQTHRGRYAIKLASTAATPDPTPSSPGGAGLYKVADFPEEAYYSAWYYVPRAYQTTTSWTIFRFATPLAAGDAGIPDAGAPSAVNDAGSASQPSDAGAAAGDVGAPLQPGPAIGLLIDIRIQSLPGVGMTFVLFDHRHAYLQEPMPNPPPLVPLDRWFHIECFYRNVPDATGHLTIWFDGASIYDVARPMSASRSVYFSPCSLADFLSPSNLELYVDDVAVSWKRVTPRGVFTLTN